ncbi:hypothetical protein FAZ19_16130 [Sphingobacterium alkalisoli]|uniref:Uncharacterized protein n=1 Tax=Sphingobacterium alkalisoli TaxID=1874115 RepID=A0A4U0GYL0_9SPHI|nr:hypothetical protein [Sphingobacterium alkalisoli]TJY63794.1 hypothetical protein FAZ19_16130 [Sphingobacterium alkalisoli]GGH24848.1 hypothetical protein GCM10011418_33040 [Sphingobacterium alkalisoli]
MYTLLEVKDQIAKQRGFNNWQHIEEHDYKGLFNPAVLQSINDQVTWTYNEQFVEVLRDVVNEHEANPSPTTGLSGETYLNAKKLVNISKIK